MDPDGSSQKNGIDREDGNGEEHNITDNRSTITTTTTKDDYKNEETNIPTENSMKTKDRKTENTTAYKNNDPSNQIMEVGDDNNCNNHKSSKDTNDEETDFRLNDDITSSKEEEKTKTSEGNDGIEDPDLDNVRNSKKIYLSYASVTKETSQTKRKETIEERKKRIFTFFNLTSSENCTNHIARALEGLFSKKLATFVDCIQRDTRYRSRYNVMFKLLKDKEHLLAVGITVNGQKIIGNIEKRALRRVEKFFIPNFPAYGTSEDLSEIFRNKGLIRYISQKFDFDLGVNVQGWTVGLVQPRNIPDQIEFDGQLFNVISPYTERKPKISTDKYSPPKLLSLDITNTTTTKSLNKTDLTSFIDEINREAEQVDLQVNVADDLTLSDSSSSSTPSSSDSEESVISSVADGPTGKRKKRRITRKKGKPWGERRLSSPAPNFIDNNPYENLPFDSWDVNSPNNTDVTLD